MTNPLLIQLRETRRAWRKEATWFLVFSALSFSFGDLLFGIDTGSFGSIQALPAFLNQFAPVNKAGQHAFSTETKSVMNSVVWPGKLLGTLVFDPMVERLGYKISMYIVVVIQIVALIVQLTAKTWPVFSGGRIIAYFGVGIVENLVPTYCSEIAPGSLRGFFAGIMNQIVACGNLWGSGMGRAYATETSKKGWIIPVAIQFIPPLMMAILCPFCPESPRWLVQTGKRSQAVQALNRLRPKHDVDSGITEAEADALEAAIEESKLNSRYSGSWTDLFRGSYRRRAFIGMMCFLANQCCGNQLINLYGPTFFKSVGLNTQAFSYTMIITGVAIAAGIFGIFIVDIVGRRNICMFGMGLASIFLAIEGGVGSQKPLTTTDIHTIVACFVFVGVGNKMSYNPLCYVIAGELGGVRMRKKLMAWSTAWDVVFAFAMSYSIPYLIGTPGANLQAKAGFFFMAIAIVVFLFTAFFMPELSGRSLEEVDELFERRLWAWQFAGAETTGAGRRIHELELGRNDPKAQLHEQDHELQASGLGAKGNATQPQEIA